LKRIKNKSWSSMGQEKLDAAGILSIESDVTASIDFDEIIYVFSKQKARKKVFNNLLEIIVFYNFLILFN